MHMQADVGECEPVTERSHKQCAKLVCSSESTIHTHTRNSTEFKPDTLIQNVTNADMLATFSFTTLIVNMMTKHK